MGIGRRHRFLFTVCSALAALCLAATGCSEDTIEINGRVYNEAQWADTVIESSAGVSEDIVANFAEPSAALGPPDWDEVAGTGAVSIGETGDTACAARLVVAFVDNRLFNGDGPDLRIEEVGSTPEAIEVSIRIDGDSEWIDVGALEFGDSELELDGIDPTQSFSQVRLCSVVGPVVGGDISAESAGPDVDAVAAINSRTA